MNDSDSACYFSILCQQTKYEKYYCLLTTSSPKTNNRHSSQS